MIRLYDCAHAGVMEMAAGWQPALSGPGVRIGARAVTLCMDEARGVEPDVEAG